MKPTRDSKTGKFVKGVAPRIDLHPVQTPKTVEKLTIDKLHAYMTNKKKKFVVIELPSSKVDEVRTTYRDQGARDLGSPYFMVLYSSYYCNQFQQLVGVTIKENDTQVVKVQESFLIDYNTSVNIVDDETVNDLALKVIRNNLNLFSIDFSIGSDPEIFVESNTGEMIPAFQFLPSKHEPAIAPMTMNYNGYGGNSLYWDGYQGEFNTTPRSCLGQHIDSIAAGLCGVYLEAKKKFPESRLSLKSVFRIPEESLMSEKEEYVEFGCMPSFNVYGLRVNMPPARMVPFRSAGGHIHFGIGAVTEKEATPIVKALDAILAVSCVSLFNGVDDPTRRMLYGLPGEYRRPPHGLEYRPLSNAWLCHPMITNLVLDFSRRVLMFGRLGLLKLWNASEQETIDCVINCDLEKAHEIMDRNKDLLKSIIKSSYPSWMNDAKSENAYNVFYNGINSVIESPDDFEKNWKFTTGWIYHTGSNTEPNVYKLIHRSANTKF